MNQINQNPKTASNDLGVHSTDSTNLKGSPVSMTDSITTALTNTPAQNEYEKNLIERCKHAARFTRIPCTTVDEDTKVREDNIRDQVKRYWGFMGSPELVEVQMMGSVSPQHRGYEFISRMVRSSYDLATTAIDSFNHLPAAVYTHINTLDPAILARQPADKWVGQKKGESTSGRDFVAVNQMYIDIDSKRISGVSATNEEVEVAWQAAKEIYLDIAKFLGADTALAIGMSGNGYQIHIALERIDAGNHPLQQAFTAKINKLFRGINQKYARNGVILDESVKDIKRLAPLWGTEKRKGVETNERPYRLTWIATAESPTRLTAEQFDAIVNHFGADDDKRSKKSNTKGEMSEDSKAALYAELNRIRTSVKLSDVAEWLGVVDDSGNATCPNCQAVSGAGYFETRDGVELFHCFHGTCANLNKTNRNALQLVQDVHDTANLVEAANMIAGQFGLDPVKVKGGKSPSSPIDNSTYIIENGKICMKTEAGTAPLCNFVARIVRDINIDDGASQESVFEIEGLDSKGNKLGTAKVPSEEFSKMDWVVPAFRSRAIINPGRGTRDMLRAAIQHLSDPTFETVYSHTGWRQVNGQWDYLWHGGSLSGEGSIRVELGENLKNTKLPDIDPDTLADDVAMSFSMLHLAPPTVTYPLLAATYLAPLSSILQPDFVVWANGPTGSFKSELVARAQAHFGNYTRRNLPGSWTSTPNAIEAMLFTMKDTLTVIDDYAPQGTQKEQQKLIDNAHRVIRSVGNGSGRGRLTASCEARTTKTPRGCVISTGEMLPSYGTVGASILARLVVLEIEKSKVNLECLTRMQQHGPALARAMRGFLAWVAPQYDKLVDTLPIKRDAWREYFAKIDAGHARAPEALATLATALELFFDFAESVGVNIDLGKSAQTGKSMGSARKWIVDALSTVADRQSKTQAATEPGVRFVEILSSLFDSGRASLSSDKKSALIQTSRDCPQIGWIDKDANIAYLLPKEAQRVVVEYTKSINEHWTPTAESLTQSLRAKGLVTSWSAGEKRADPKRSVGGGQTRVWEMPLNVLMERDPEECEKEPTPEEKAAKRAQREAILESEMALQEQAEREAAARHTEKKYRYADVFN